MKDDVKKSPGSESMPLTAVIRIMTRKRAVDRASLKRLAHQVWDGAGHIYAAMAFGNNLNPAFEEVLEYVSYWPDDWGDPRLKSGVRYIIIPFGLNASPDQVAETAYDFCIDVFDPDGLLGMYDYVYGVHSANGRNDIHLLVNRRGEDRQLLTLPVEGERSLAMLRSVLAEKACKNGILMTAK